MRRVAKIKSKWAYEAYLEALNSITDEIEKTYDVEIFGNPGLQNLQNLKTVLDNYADLAGNARNLNDILHDAMRAKDLKGKIGISFLPQSGRAKDLNWNGSYSAAWCSNNGDPECSGFQGNIILSENIFTTKYQFTITSFDRASIVGNDLNLAIQISMAHEFGHVFADARPKSLPLYGGDEEDMANVLAVYVVTGGLNMSQSDLTFITATQTQGLWNSTWFYPNWP